MRQIFITNDSAATLQEAEDYAPWAAEIVAVDGGHLAFESVDDAATWRRQA